MRQIAASITRAEIRGARGPRVVAKVNTVKIAGLTGLAARRCSVLSPIANVFVDVYTVEIKPWREAGMDGAGTYVIIPNALYWISTRPTKRFESMSIIIITNRSLVEGATDDTLFGDQFNSVKK